MGADHRAFDRIKLEGYDQTHIPWLLPDKKESFQSYARRLAEPILKAKNPMVIGVSLGGMLASEMTSFIPHMRAIIISSVKSPEERSALLKLGRTIPLQRLLPKSFIKKGTWFWGQAHKQIDKSEVDYMIKMFHDQDERFLKWAMINTPLWKGRGDDNRIFHIHGDKDELFPFKKIKDAHLVKGGTHFMVFTRGKEISKIIQDELLRLENGQA
ncbi:MAG: pimeloyl-ACP methyl ester carboxylesterase [Bacteroidia bacterium]